jgi:hypothetical protein
VQKLQRLLAIIGFAAVGAVGLPAMAGAVTSPNASASVPAVSGLVSLASPCDTVSGALAPPLPISLPRQACAPADVLSDTHAIAATRTANSTTAGVGLSRSTTGVLTLGGVDVMALMIAGLALMALGYLVITFTRRRTYSG